MSFKHTIGIRFKPNTFQIRVLTVKIAVFFGPFTLKRGSKIIEFSFFRLI